MPTLAVAPAVKELLHEGRLAWQRRGFAELNNGRRRDGVERIQKAPFRWPVFHLRLRPPWFREQKRGEPLW
jgi:hypothetical protein